MAATARQIPVTAGDLAGNGGGAYASLEVPGDYELVLRDVEDYDYRAKGKSYGWLFLYDCETPAGGSVEFRVYVSFNENARWKMIEVLEAHGCDLSEGLNTVDPNALIGDVIGGHIDFPRDNDGNPTSKYREIRQVFSLAQEPELASPEVVAGIEPRPSIVETHDPAVDGEKFGNEPQPI